MKYFIFTLTFLALLACSSKEDKCSLWNVYSEMSGINEQNSNYVISKGVFLFVDDDEYVKQEFNDWQKTKSLLIRGIKVQKRFSSNLNVNDSSFEILDFLVFI